MAVYVTALNDSELLCCKCGKLINPTTQEAICVEGKLYHDGCVGVSLSAPAGMIERTQNTPRRETFYATIQLIGGSSPDGDWRPVVVQRARGHTPDHPSWRVRWLIGIITTDKDTARRMASEHARIFGLGFMSNPPQGLPVAVRGELHDGADSESDK